MADWNALRRRARVVHQQLRVHLPPDKRANLLPPADLLLAAAEQETEVDRRGVPASDPLLAGAHAVLDRDFPAIWYATGLDISRARQRFAQAHEFAHYWLHPEVGEDHCNTDETPEAFAPPSYRINQSQVAEGYSHKERRESEANLFAAELLLPCPQLHQLFTQYRWPATRIANHAGLSLSCVHSQLTSALLTGAGQTKEEAERALGVKASGVRRLALGADLEASSNAPTPDDSSLPNAQRPTPDALFALDPSQRAAASVEVGPVLVDAGPGTGKTRTLIARVLYLLTERRVVPENILALTFSNKAAEEMHTRLRAEVGDLADRVWIGTFHAFGRELLRKEGHRIGLQDRSVELIDLPDAVKLLEENVDRLHLTHFEFLNQPILPFPDILECISRAKDELVTPQMFLEMARRRLNSAHACLLSAAQMAGKGASGREKKEQRVRREEGERLQVSAEKWLEVGQVYEVYQELLREAQKLDFGDLLMRSVELLDGFPDVRARWQRQYPHLLADEYQDINRASAKLVQRLAGEGRGLWAVGDLRQAIYRFRGASPANVREFEIDFPGAKKLELQRNYRSLPPLVALFGAYAGNMSGMAAEAFADWMPNRSEEKSEEKSTDELVSVTSSSLPSVLPSVTVATADDEEAQADGMAVQIQAWEARGVPQGEQVVLCYTHNQATRLAERLAARGIETQHLGGLFDRVEVKDLFALLSLACEPEGTALRRVARFPEYAIPDEDVLLLLKAAREEKRPFPAALALGKTTQGLSSAGRSGLGRLFRHLTALHRQRSAWAILAWYLFEVSDYLRPLLAEPSVSARQRLLAINELLAVALRLQSRFETEENPPLAFLNHLRYLLSCRQERTVRMSGDDGELDGVRLMTIHRSKGLEFPVVYLPNLVKDQFPTGKVSRMVAPPTDWNDPIGGLTDPEEEDAPDGKEIENLFFVALSRARDALVLSRPLTWNGRPVDTSPLLRQAEPALKACHAVHVHWSNLSDEGAEKGTEEGAAISTESDQGEAQTGEDNAVPKTATDPEASSLTLSAGTVERYRDCPRRYYYEQVLELPRRSDRTPYLAARSGWQETVRWLQSERAAGRVPTREEASAHLLQQWNNYSEVLTGAQGRVLKQRAESWLDIAYRDVQQARTMVTGLELEAKLEHGTVRVPVDHAEMTGSASGGEGQAEGLRLVDFKTRRNDREDHRDIRLALARHAARQQRPERPVQIVLGYLGDGEQREIEETTRYEPDRVKKYDEALRNIREGHFEPNPGPTRCAECPFFLVCPY